MNKSILLFAFILNLFITFESDAQNVALNDSIKAIVAAKEIPGLFISVGTKDSVLLQTGFGFANLSSQEKVTDHTMFRIGSISKTFTSLAILHLIEQGDLSLETPLREIAPEIHFKNKWESTHPVLVKHLLGHKAGFDDMHFNAIVGIRKPGMTALEEVQAMTNSLESRWEPGLLHSYSNPGYAVLGYLIEKVTKMPYQEYIHKEVLQKLGMNDTHYISEEEKYPNQSYSKGFGIDRKDVGSVAIIGEGVGSLLSNASDMSKFLKYFLNVEMQDSLRIVSPALMAEMQKPQGWFEKANNINEGYGYGIYDRRYGTEDLAFKGHNGGVMGFVSDYIFSEELDLGIMISSNTEVSNRKILNLLVDYYTKGTKGPIAQTISGPVSTKWDGTYKLINERNELFRFINLPVRTTTIKAMGDSLMAQYFMGNPVYYKPVSETAFIAAGEATPTLFLALKNGQRVIYDEDQLMMPTSSFSYLLLRIALSIAFLASFSLILTFFVRLIGSFFKVEWKKGLSLLLITAMPILLFISSVIILMSKSTLTEMVSLANISSTSIAILLMSTLGPFLLIISIILGLKKYWKNFTKWQKAFYAITWSCTAFFVIYCIYFGWFGIALWRY